MKIEKTVKKNSNSENKSKIIGSENIRRKPYKKTAIT